MSILKLLSEEHMLMLDALDGKETLANAEEVFPSGIDVNFKNYGTNKPGVATKETPVDLYELVRSGIFAEMFGSLGTDLGKLCLTQAQIKNFCKKNTDWLRKNGYPTFFLFKAEDQFFVAQVCVTRSDGLGILAHHFKHGIWRAEYSYRLVVPRLTA